MRRVLTLAAVIAFVVGAGGSVGAQEGLRLEVADTSGYPDVVLVVTVPQSLAGVDVSEGFTVLEHGARRQSVARALAGDPLEVMLLVDVSGSMAGAPLAAATAAASEFADGLPADALVGVIGFGTSVIVSTPLTTDRTAVAEGLEGLAATGETALYDAVVAAVDAFETDYEARRFIVLVSDGGDTASAVSIEEARAALEGGDIGLYAVSLITEESDLGVLESLASAATGRVVPAEDGEGLSLVYQEVASDLASQYLVVYRSAADGSTRVVVSVVHGSIAASTTATLDLPLLIVTAPDTTAGIPSSAAPVANAAVAGPVAPRIGSELVVPAPEAVIGLGPGLLGKPGALAVGVTAVGLALVLMMAPMFVPNRPNRTGLSAATAVSSLGALVTGVTGKAESFMSRVLRGRDRERALDHWLDSAGIALRPGEFLLFSASLILAALAITAMFGGLFAVLLVGVVALLVPWLIIKVRIDRRRNAFADQLDGTLQMIAGSLRAGYGLLQSINTVSSEAPVPTCDEFQSVVMETRLGRDLIVALDSTAHRVASQDFEWIVQAIRIQREVGGDLADLLDTIASTIRDRRQVHRQVQAMSAEGKLSAAVLIVLPFAIALVITVTTPGYLSMLWETGTGRVLMIGGTILMALGTFWIRRIVRLVF